MNKIPCTLLVDDDDTANFCNQMLLEDLAVTQKVLVAHNGEDAMTLLQQLCLEGNCPELILLDVNMPVMNGFEFLEAYAQLECEHKQSVVIVMLTTSLNPRDIGRLKEVPIKGVLNKPLTKKMVQEILDQHFGRE